jgi:hypothetical protein
MNILLQRLRLYGKLYKNINVTCISLHVITQTLEKVYIIWTTRLYKCQGTDLVTNWVI